MSGMELALATNGRWSGKIPESITGICTDSRHLYDGSVFLALRGPHYDGHDFASQAADSCTALIGDEHGSKQWHTIKRPQLIVNDTQIALGDIAAAWRRRLTHTSIIAISGSYGKTTVRSMLVHVFSSLGLETATNQANHNNLIGVPQTLLSISEQADIAIIECGISEPGEMKRLAEIVQPDAAVLTGLSSAHGQGLGGLDGVVREKFDIIAGVAANGWCVLGQGVHSLLEQRGMKPKVAWISMDAHDDSHVSWSLVGNELNLQCGTETHSIRLALPARHWAEDMALTSTVIRKVLKERGTPASLSTIAESLASWKPVTGRMNVVKGRGDSLILDDCYNANPASMQAAVDTLAHLDGNHIAILGDMAELGDDAVEQHASIDVSGIDQLILIGPEMHHLAVHHPDALWLADTDAACRHLGGLQLGSKDRVLVKASRSMRLDRIVTMLAHGDKGSTRAI